MISYIGVIQEIKNFADQHNQIKKNAYEFVEQMPNFATKDTKYPLMFGTLISSRITDELHYFTLDIYCFDIIQKDRANSNTILSDTHLILSDLYHYFRDSEISDKMYIISEGNISPINNALLDYCIGNRMTVEFEVEASLVCEIPFIEETNYIIDEFNNIFADEFGNNFVWI